MPELKKVKGIEIYTWKDCPYCKRAKEILNAHNIKAKYIIEHQIDDNEEAREKMALRCFANSGDVSMVTWNEARSIPRIFVDDELIGGCYTLVELDDNNTFDEKFAKYIDHSDGKQPFNDNVNEKFADIHNI